MRRSLLLSAVIREIVITRYRCYNGGFVLSPCDRSVVYSKLLLQMLIRLLDSPLKKAMDNIESIEMECKVK